MLGVWAYGAVVPDDGGAFYCSPAVDDCIFAYSDAVRYSCGVLGGSVVVWGEVVEDELV